MTEITIADPSALSIHPAAALFPLLDERELAELAGDIQTNGLASPIVVKDGQILDGRNRLRACELAGVPPHFVEWAGTGSVTSSDLLGQPSPAPSHGLSAGHARSARRGGVRGRGARASATGTLR